MKILLGILFFAVTALLPVAPQAGGGRDQVLRAVETMLAAGPERDISQEARLVTTFAEESRDVEIVLETRFLGFLGGGLAESVRNDLLSFYLAGATRFDLTNPAQRSHALADVVPALEAVLHRYERLRKRDPRLRDPFLDRVAAHAARGRLREFVTSAPAAPSR